MLPVTEYYYVDKLPARKSESTVDGKKRYDKCFKHKVAVEAIRGKTDMEHILVKYQVKENLVLRWKKQVLAASAPYG